MLTKPTTNPAMTAQLHNLRKLQISGKNDEGPSAKIRRTSGTPESLPVAEKRLQQRKTIIMQAFKDGRIAFRVIEPDRESQYLSQQRKYPRPVYIVQEGVPVEFRGGNTTIAISRYNPLYPHKREAGTSENMYQNQQYDDAFISSKLLPSLHSLQNKMHEQSERALMPVYQPLTSGHLQPDGSFTLPKKSNFSRTDQIPFSEVVIESYDTADICGFVVSREKIIPGIEGCNLANHLDQKRALQEKLNIKQLPLIIYSKNTGTIQIFFDEEIPTTVVSELRDKEDFLKHAFLHSGIETGKYHDIVGILPFNRLLQLLNDTNLTDPKWKNDYIQLAKLLTKTRPNYALYQLVSKPDHYCVDTLNKFTREGVNLRELIVRPDNYQIFLSDCLLLSEYQRVSDKDKHRESVIREKAYKLLYELFKEKVPFSLANALYRGSTTPHLFKLYIAARNLATEKYNSFNTDLFCALVKFFPSDTAGRRVAMNMVIEEQLKPENRIQQTLANLLFNTYWNYSFHTEKIKKNTPYSNEIQEAILLLYRNGANPEPLIESLLKKFENLLTDQPDNYAKLFNTHTPKQIINSIITFWHNHQAHPMYTAWPDKLARDTAEIDALTEELGLTNYQLPATETANNRESSMELIADAVKQPLIFTSPPGDNDDTARTVLNYFYRGPGPEILAHPASIPATFPNIWKPMHSCSHALRVRNNVLWYIELLETNHIAEFTAREKELLALAAIYHDAFAETVDKKDEENRAADALQQNHSSHYSAELLNSVADALRRKEDDVKKDANAGDRDDQRDIDESRLDEETRLYLRVLRFADRMEIIRCEAIGEDFPQWDKEKYNGGFNPAMLDIPPDEYKKFSSIDQQKTVFQRQLEAAMHGAVDLASVTGSYHIDGRIKGTYCHRHGIDPNHNQLKVLFERTPHPLSVMDTFVDDNVRRMIARLAGIQTCSDTEHQVCQANPATGVSRGIHNAWHDLKQVRIPPGMTRLEKMQCEHDVQLLKPETLTAIRSEVTRLKSRGILLNPGTLTQTTLQSPAARSMLAQRGISVITEKRQRGFVSDRRRKFEDILVPITKKTD